MDEQQLFKHAVRFRQAIESSDFSEDVVGREGHLRMDEFPQGACAEACTLFGLYLVERMEIKPIVEWCGQIEVGDKWYGSHHWLEHSGIVIDITADQFPMVNEPVVVSRNSFFHEHHCKDIGTIAISFNLAHQSDWMIKLYDHVRQELEFR